MLEFFTTRDREKILEKAVKLKAEGRLDQAIKTLESSVGDSPEDFDLLLELARNYFEAGRRIDSVTALRKAYSLDTQRRDEVVGALTDLHYRGSSPIETGDALIEVYITQHEFEELERTLKSLSNRDLQLLETRYTKIYENIIKSKNPNAYTHRDLNVVIQLCSVQIFMGRLDHGFELADRLLSVKESDKAAVQSWARSVSRWKWNDPRPPFFLMRLYLAFQKYEEALQAASRTIDLDKSYGFKILEEFNKITLPPNIQVDFLSFLSNLEVEVKNVDDAIASFNRLLDLEPGKIEDVIRGLRELLRLSPKEIKIHFALGDTYLRAQRTTLAVEEYAKIIEINPDIIDEVIKRYEKVFKADPKNPQVISYLVEAYLIKDNVAMATDVIERCYSVDPGLAEEYVMNLNLILEKDINNLKALNLLALSYFKKGEIDNAVVVMESLLNRGKEGKAMAETGARAILSSDPKNVHAQKILIDSLISQERAAEAISLIQERASDDPTESIALLPKIDDLICADQTLLEQGRTIYNQLKDQDEFLINLVMGRSYAYEKDYDQALAYLEKSLALDPARHEDVKKVMIDLIQRDPKAVPLMIYIARVYLKEGDIDKSARFFRAAQMIDPSIFSEIIDDFYDIVKAHPGDVMMRRLLIDSLFNKGLYDRTVEECRITVEAVSGKESAYFHLKQAQSLLAKGRLTDAVRPFMLAQENDINFTNEVIEGLEKILSMDRNNIPAHFALGRAYGAARMVNKAVKELLLTARIVPTRINYVMDELKRLEGLAPANAMVHFAQGMLMVEQKKFDEGIAELDQAREMEKNLLDQIVPIYENIEIENPTPMLFLSQARAYADKGTFAPAVEYFRKAFECDPNLLEQVVSGLKGICNDQPENSEARRLLAQIYFDYNALDDAIAIAQETYRTNAGHRAWAIEFAREILAKDAKHIPTYYFLSELCFDENKFGDAIEALNKLKAFAPQEVPEIIKQLEEVYGKNEFVPELIIALADRYIEIAQEIKVVQLLRHLFNTDSSFADGVLLRLRNILKKKPDVIECYFLTADILTAQKDYQRAREALEYGEKYATEIEDKVELRLRLANLFNILGDDDKASTALMKALRIAHNKQSVFAAIKDLHHKSLINRLEVLRSDDSNDGRLEAARIHVALGRLSEAEKSLDFVPDNFEMKKRQALIRSQILVAKNRVVDALELLRSYRDDERFAIALADIYEKIGSYAAAIATLKSLKRDEFGPRIKINETRLVEAILTGKKRILEGRR